MIGGQNSHSEVYTLAYLDKFTYVFDLTNNRLLVNDLPRLEPLVEVGVRAVEVELLVRRALREVEAAALDGLDELAHALLLEVLLAHLQEDLRNAGLSGLGKSEENIKPQNAKLPIQTSPLLLSDVYL